MAWLGRLATLRRGRASFVVAGLVGWLAVVVIGAGPRASEPTTWLGVLHLDNIVQVVMLVVAFVGLVTFIVASPFVRQWSEPQRRSGRRGAAGFMGLLVLALLLWRPEILDGLVDSSMDASAPESAQPTPPIDQVPRQPVAQLMDLAVVLGAVAALAAVWVLVRRAARSSDPAPSVAGDGLGPGVFDAFDLAHTQLFEGRDPRSSVIAAYATLEQAFAAHGHGRRVGETIGEHLGRATTQLDIDPATVARLGALYERARFSHHEITVQEQHDAAHDLATARATLRATV